MKNFNIFWIHFFRGGGGGLQKTNIDGGVYLKRGGGLRQFAYLREEAWQEREGIVFEGKG